MQYTTLVPSVVAPGTILTCSRCSHKWAVRKKGELPKNCPKCRSTLWMKNYHVYTCMKCEHSWGTANDNPLRCPKCHTSKWNTPSAPRTVRTEPIRSRLLDETKKEVLSKYNSGMPVMKIAIEMDIAFSEIMDTILESNPNEDVRL